MFSMPHVHTKLWIKNAPLFDPSIPGNAQEVEAYIKRTMTCRIPDQAGSPNLYLLHQKFQVPHSDYSQL